MRLRKRNCRPECGCVNSWKWGSIQAWLVMSCLNHLASCLSRKVLFNKTTTLFTAPHASLSSYWFLLEALSFCSCDPPQEALSGQSSGCLWTWTIFDIRALVLGSKDNLIVDINAQWTGGKGNPDFPSDKTWWGSVGGCKTPIMHACVWPWKRQMCVCMQPGCLPSGAFLANSLTKPMVPAQCCTNSHWRRAEGQLGPFLIRKWDFILPPPADRCTHAHTQTHTVYSTV